MFVLFNSFILNELFPSFSDLSLLILLLYEGYNNIGKSLLLVGGVVLDLLVVPLLLLPPPAERICENGVAQRVRPLAVVVRTQSMAAQTWRAEVGLLLRQIAWKRLEE